MLPRSGKPWKDAKIYVVGDCYSSVQGWVEGAFNTRRAYVLRDHLGLEVPGWLDGVYIGY